MGTYVTLYNFTDQALRNIKDTLNRAQAAKQAAALWLHGLGIVGRSDIGCALVEHS